MDGYSAGGVSPGTTYSTGTNGDASGFVASADRYVPRDGDSIRITIDPDGQHYAVYGAYEDGKPYRGWGDCHTDAASLHFDTWHPWDADA